MKKELFKNGYVATIEEKLGCKYSEINRNRENRIKAVTSIAAISRGNAKSNNPEKRYERLLNEASDNATVFELLTLEEHNVTLSHVAGRPLEYCPVVLKAYPVTLADDYGKTTQEIVIKLNGCSLSMPITSFMNHIGKFSYIEEDTPEVWTVYTNARTLLNAGIKEENVPFNSPVDLANYFVVEVKVPYFVFAQMRTHGMLSQIAVSSRVTDTTEYWLPEDLLERVSKSDLPIKGYLQTARNEEAANQALLDAFKIGFSNDAGKAILKKLGYPKEVYNRVLSFMEYKTFIIGGWLNNPYQWGHFLLEREAFAKVTKSWVQKETRETALAIRDLIEKYTIDLNLSLSTTEG